MTESLTHTAPLTRWQGDKAVYHLLRIEGDVAGAIAMHARLHRLEFGRQRGFGSIKVVARIGGTEWKTSVFPQKDTPSSSSDAVGQQLSSSSEASGQQRLWILLVGKKVMRAEDLAPGDPVSVELELL